MVEMKSVKSSNIEAVGFDETLQELYVRFKGGNLYVYYEVPDLDYVNFMAADSPGGWLNANIKGKYKYRKIEDVPRENP